MRLNEADAAIAERVKETLADLGVSAAELGRRCGWSQPYIARRMAGRVPWLATDLQSVAAALEVPATRFLPGLDRFPWDAASDRVLANEAALDPEDHSSAAEYVREVAGSVRDHRSVRAGSA